MPNGDISDLVERAVGGPAMEESIVLNELESVFEEELQGLLDIDREDTFRQEDINYYAQLLEVLAQSTTSRAEPAKWAPGMGCTFSDRMVYNCCRPDDEGWKDRK